MPWYFVGRGMKYNDLAISTKFVEVIGHPMEVEILTFRTLALRHFWAVCGLHTVPVFEAIMSLKTRKREKQKYISQMWIP